MIVIDSVTDARCKNVCFISILFHMMKVVVFVIDSVTGIGRVVMFMIDSVTGLGE